MFNSNFPDSDLLKTVLEPLLEDFQYWLGRSRLLLETETIPFLDTDEQADLLARVITAQQEVSTAKMLFDATNGQVGIESSALAPWHRLVTECWQVATRFRTEGQTEKGI
ncbi:DUF2605 domain-containing protein [Kovacikia minuta CCNUW1]|uniref:DUF2605 domain-containing protein n=1 Tax=Kovacikia minuta TaxID=2931930 RepID=UPI001CCB2F6A|nr:DUF2605 domain-containing protein [Kovacikia minuta]UBF26428.1 DUF2605 domain-containing protein [Kovacikia minuta CCNUW1]